MKGTIVDLRQALKKPDWPRVVVLAGEDGEARERALAAIIDAIPEEDRFGGVERFGADQPAARVLDAARTAPLLGGRRVVVANGVDWFSPGSKIGEEAQGTLSAFLKAPPEHALLVVSTTKIDARLNLTKAAEKGGMLLELARPKEKEMPGWLVERARDRGLALEPRAAQLLADAVGTNTSEAARELDKLALLAHPPNSGAAAPVGVELVEQALGPTRAAGSFALEDALLAGNGPAALEQLDRHLAGGDLDAALPLLGRMASVVRRLAAAAGIVSRGGSAEDLQKAVGGHPFVAKKYAEAAQRVGSRAERALAACVVADGWLKSGRDPRAALAKIVLALSNPPAAPGRSQ